ncbi:MAG: ERAP1-like C-terminal domain-containing protein, partial [Methylococcales bacterium]
ANFDSLTYSKGASVIKQLNTFLGAENFRQGVRNYLKAYEFKNADYDDFMSSLGNTGSGSLTGWGEEWFKQAGLNRVEPVVVCAHGKISRFEILQQSSKDVPVYRTHLTKLALYKNQDGRLKLHRVIPIGYAQERTDLPALIGEDCPAFVFLNHEDHDYVKNRIDADSLKRIQAHLSDIDDALTRAMIWHSLWEMVRDAELPLLDYISMVLEYAGNEPEIKIVSAVLETVYSRRGNGFSVLVCLPSGKIRAQQIDKIEAFLWRQLREAKAGSDFQKLWFDAYVLAARSKTALGNLVDVLKGQVHLKQFALDQDRRWNVIVAISTLDVKQGNLWRTRELARDRSSNGITRGIAAQAALPSLEIKQSWFKKIVQFDAQMTLAQLTAAMRNLFPANQLRFRATFSAEFFDLLKGELEKKDVEFMESFAASLAPTLCTPASVRRLHRFIAENPGLRPVVLKMLKIGQQEDQRCVRVREKAPARTDWPRT